MEKKKEEQKGRHLGAKAIGAGGDCTRPRLAVVGAAGEEYTSTRGACGCFRFGWPSFWQIGPCAM